MSEDGAIGGDVGQLANPMTKQVSAEAREAAEECWQEFINPSGAIQVIDDFGVIIQAAIDKSRATLPSAGASTRGICPKCDLPFTNLPEHMTCHREPSPPPPQPAEEKLLNEVCVWLRKNEQALQGANLLNIRQNQQWRVRLIASPPPQPAARSNWLASEPFFGKHVKEAIGVPSEILNMASKIGAWATQQGWKDWEIGYVADRKLVAKLQARIGELERDVDKLDGMASEWQQSFISVCEKLKASVAREADLTAALAPFARLAEPFDVDPYNVNYPDDERINGANETVAYHNFLTLGDCRKAKAVIKPASAIAATKEEGQ